MPAGFDAGASGGDAVAFSMATSLIAAFVAHGKKATWSIVLGALGTNAYLVWLYSRASERGRAAGARSEEHTSELPSLAYLVCRLLLEKQKKGGLRDPQLTLPQPALTREQAVA